MLQNFKDWWQTPFKAGMSVPQWALFILLLACIGAFWNIVLRHVRGI